LADRISKAARSRNMARIRGRETGPELALRRALWRRGLRYRTHTRAPGRPDIAFLRERLAVFVDGCFWHSCPQHGVAPKANRAFWARKLKSNIQRDRRSELELTKLGWTFMRFWEHDVDEGPEQCARAVAARLKRKRQRRPSD
jgi:DNA mismatch endonuclease (patch repair protein)